MVYFHICMNKGEWMAVANRLTPAPEAPWLHPVRASDQAACLRHIASQGVNSRPLSGRLDIHVDDLHQVEIINDIIDQEKLRVLGNRPLIRAVETDPVAAWKTPRGSRAAAKIAPATLAAVRRLARSRSTPGSWPTRRGRPQSTLLALGRWQRTIRTPGKQPCARPRGRPCVLQPRQHDRARSLGASVLSLRQRVVRP